MRPKAYRDIGGFIGTGIVLLGTGMPHAEEQILSEVQVSAKAESQEIRRNATAGKLVFDRAELDTLDAASLGELLRKLPGTGMFSDIDNSAKGRGRGPDRNLPQILVDGQPLPGGDRNPATALRLPVEMIERVEIIRNSTAEFPVVNSAGVINLILRDVPPKPTRGLKVGVGTSNDDPQYRLEGQYGEPDGNDFGYLLSGALNRRPDSGSHGLNATTYGSGATGNITENSRYTGKDTNLTLSPRFSWKLPDNQRLTVSPFLTHTVTERTTTLDRTTSGVASQDLEHDEVERTSGRLVTEWRINGAQGAETTVKFLVQGERENADQHTGKYDGSGSQTAYLRNRTERSEGEWMGEFRAKRLFLDAHVVTAAMEWRGKASEDNQRQTGSVTSDNTAKLRESRQVGWVQDEWQLTEQQVLTPGLRWTYLTTRIDDDRSGEVERSFRSLDPSLHYLWQLSDQWNLRASIARNTRVPFSRELVPVTRLTTGTNSSSNPDRGGNPDLKPERSRSVELGVEYFLGQKAGTVGLSVFNRRVENYAQRLVQQESGRWVERPYNVGEAELQGVIFDFKSKLVALGLPELTLRGNVGYTHTRLLEQVAGLGAGEGPRKSANVGADYEIPAWRLTVGGNFNFVSSLNRESSATVTQVQGIRRQLDLYALYKLDRQTAVRFSALNVTKEDRRNYLAETDGSGNLVRTDNEFTPGIASYMVTLEAKW